MVARVGSNPFDTVAIDVSSIESASAAADDLIRRGHVIDTLLLNAGLVSGDEMKKSVDGLEMTFAASIIGHHILTTRLLDADVLNQGANVAIVGSEAANNDLPALMGMSLYDFATGAPTEFGDNLRSAMLAFARGEKPALYDGNRYYATTKVFSAWWSAAMARKYGDRISVYTVSPGANMSTNAARHTKGFKRLLYTKVMPAIGPILGWDQPVSKGAKRYLDVLHNVDGKYENGRTYTSQPKKMVGPLHKVEYVHILDTEHQNVALAVIEELASSGTVSV